MIKLNRVVVLLVFGLLVMSAVAVAEVERIEITSRSIFADGMEYGEVGAYEKIRGTLFYAVDPDNVANAAIVDLDLAPRGADGNGVGGIRLAELEAPLGTYQGWNPRAAIFGSPDHLTRFDGSFWAFELSESGREAVGDPRVSVEARYPSKGQYVARVSEAARRLVADRILLAEDGEAYVDRAKRLAWPPAPIDSDPFWRLEPAVEAVEMPVAVPVF